MIGSLENRQAPPHPAVERINQRGRDDSASGQSPTQTRQTGLPRDSRARRTEAPTPVLRSLGEECAHLFIRPQASEYFKGPSTCDRALSG